MGFFFHAETKYIDKNEQIASKYSCSVCPLNKEIARYTKLAPTGSENPIIYNIGEAPGFQESEEGVQFVGDSGKLLRNALAEVFGKSFINEHMRWNNIIACRPPDNREPAPFEVQCCRQRLLDDIAETKPFLIMGYGGVPLKWMTEGKIIGLWRGRTIPVKIKDHICWYLPSYHPSFILRNKKSNNTGGYDVVFKLDIETARKLIESEEEPVFIESGYEDNIKIFSGLRNSELDEIETHLQTFINKDHVALDIETYPPKRVYTEGATILSIAIGTHEDTIVFPIDHPECTWKNSPRIKEILYNFIISSPPKVCHNVKFELEWLTKYFDSKSVIYGTEWEDTMGQAYTLDERTSRAEGMLNLDILCIQNFGFHLKELSNIDYDKMLTYPIQKLLLYNGMDTKYTSLLFETQRDRMSPTQMSVYKRTVEVSKTLTYTQIQGLNLDQKLMDDYSCDFEAQIKETEELIKELPEIKQYEKIYGEYNASSSPQLTVVLKDLLKLPQVKETKGHGYSVDNEVLDLFVEQRIELASLTLKHRGISKLKSTYIDGIREVIFPDYKIHSQFNNMFTSTYRISSEFPNLQNFPSREDIEIRDIIIPPDKHYLAAFDFGQIEARVIAMVSNDEKWKRQISEGFDIHKHWAKRILEIYPQRVGVSSIRDVDEATLKDFRSIVKNRMVFPFFYNAWYTSVARNLGIPDHIARQIYNEFWEEYSQAKIWQNETIAFYNKHGYVQTLNGARRHGPLSTNEAVNMPIQGSAAEIVLDAGNRLARYSYESGLPQFHYSIQIHDDLTFKLPEESIEEDISIIAKEMCNPVFSFINVPLSVEVKVGKSWGSMEEIATFSTTDFTY
jgi:uracil-DNA glycosylase family 4